MEHPISPITIDVLARTLKLSVRWLKQETRANRIPSLRAGRKRLYSLPAVREALAAQAGRGGAEGGAA